MFTVRRPIFSSLMHAFISTEAARYTQSKCYSSMQPVDNTLFVHSDFKNIWKSIAMLNFWLWLKLENQAFNSTSEITLIIIDRQHTAAVVASCIAWGFSTNECMHQTWIDRSASSEHKIGLNKFWSIFYIPI